MNKFSIGQSVYIRSPLENTKELGIIQAVEEESGYWIYFINHEWYAEAELEEVDFFAADFSAQEHFEKALSFKPTLLSATSRTIEYRDDVPKPFEVQIPLWEYFERVKRHRADPWQKDLCNRLQDALVNRHIKRWWACIHAEGQLGKTSIISQCFPAWILGHLPAFRYALAMYNVSRSQIHSGVVIEIMSSNLHKDIFPNKDGWLFIEENAAFGRKISKAGWSTNARREINDGQLSFNPVGLRSGLTGSGFDWLSIDDPYRDTKDAFSRIINEGLQHFYDFTVQTRTGLHSCISGMFHRYQPEDLAGYLLDTGDFEYLRYATQYDGPYIHEKTGKRYDDPIGREIGEYISPKRRPPEYYDKPRQKQRVWLSMFQGRPSSEFGDFFNVGKIQSITKDEGAEREKTCLAIARAYDLASSTTDEAAYSVGVKMGIRANGKITIFDLWRERVDTAERTKKQKEIAKKDGPDVTVVLPIDPGQAGRTTVFFIQQVLKGYTVVGRDTSGSKEERAHDFSVAVNDNMVEMVEATTNEDGENWNNQLKTELRDFPLSDYKDITDACSDAYNHLFEIWTRGTVVRTYKWYRNFIKINDFLAKFKQNKQRNGEFYQNLPKTSDYYDTYEENKKNEKNQEKENEETAIFGDSGESSEQKLLPAVEEFQLPPKFAVYAAVKINQDASKPTSAIIAARAPQFSSCPEDLFVLDEYKRYDANLYALFDWLKERLEMWKTTSEPTIWLHPDSEQYYQTIAQKLPFRVSRFKEDSLAGHNELNWYLMPHEGDHPFNAGTERAAHLYFVVNEKFYYDVSLKDENAPQSFYHARQEIKTWGFGENGEPTEIGQVLDCLRIICHKFKTYAENYTLEEEMDLTIKKFLPKNYEQAQMTHQLQQRMQAAQFLAKLEMEEKHGEDVFKNEQDDEDFLWFLKT